MKRLIIGFLLGAVIMGTGAIAYDWQKDIEVQEQRKQNRKLDEIRRQNEEILHNQKKPC